MKEKYTQIDTFSVEKIPLYMEASKNGCVVALDTETTGLHNHDDIVQLAWVVMENGELTRADFTYVQNRSVSIEGTEAQGVNGLTDAFLAVQGREPKEAYRTFKWVLDGLIERYGSIVLIAHNLPFDLRMLYNNMMRYDPEWSEQMFSILRSKTVGCDTKEFVKTLNLPKVVLPGNHLRNCIDAFALDAKNSHDALDDTRACMELFKFLTRED